jgi:hypothetical protein
VSVKTNANVRIVAEGYGRNEPLRELYTEVGKVLAENRGSVERLSVRELPSRWQGWTKHEAVIRIKRG